jgi:hypothetical protein
MSNSVRVGIRVSSGPETVLSRYYFHYYNSGELSGTALSLWNGPPAGAYRMDVSTPERHRSTLS